LVSKDEVLRTAIFECLKAAGDAGLTRSEIVPRVGSPSPATVWRHLTALEQDGVVEAWGEKGAERWFAVADDPPEDEQ
jgi:Fe2+ or Zn2+ uptake regulation protein